MKQPILNINNPWHPIGSIIILSLLLMVLMIDSTSAAPSRPGSGAALEQGQQIDNDIFALEKELFSLKHNQVNIFLHLDPENFFDITTLKAEINTKVIAKYKYSAQESAAFRQGGVHRVFSGAVRNGQYELVAHLTGKDTHNQAFSRRVSHKFTKKKGKPVFIQINISNDTERKRPTFTIEAW